MNLSVVQETKKGIRTLSLSFSPHTHGWMPEPITCNLKTEIFITQKITPFAIQIKFMIQLILNGKSTIKTETKEFIHGHLFKKGKKKKGLYVLISSSRWKRRKNLCPLNTDLSIACKKQSKNVKGDTHWYWYWYCYDIGFLSLQKVIIFTKRQG